ncbi:MAG: nucleotide exchange factor GrpE [Pelagibacterales bacterium]|nr:nucleotide exchange factor GrpE [Pelagibacterales bacterium]
MKNENLENKSEDLKENINETSKTSDEEVKEINNNSEKDPIKDLEEKVEELNDKLLRSLAESQNLRKIHDKEKEDLIKYSSSNFAREVLNIADNLERAFDLLKNNPEFNSDKFKDVKIGIELIEKELINSFERNGIKSIESVGKKFDPNYHQALNEVESDKEEGAIVNEIQKGYMLYDRLLRPAMVSISKKKKDSTK